MATKEITEPQECLQLSNLSGGWPGRHRSNLLRVDTALAVAHDLTQKGDGYPVEAAFAPLQMDVVCVTSMQKCEKMGVMELGVFGVGAGAIGASDDVVNVARRGAHNCVGVPTCVALADLRLHEGHDSAKLNLVEQMVPS